MTRVTQGHAELKCPEERVRMAAMLRGDEAVAGLEIPEVRKAIRHARRRTPARETDRAPRWYTLGGAVAELYLQLLFWEGKGELEDG